MKTSLTNFIKSKTLAFFLVLLSGSFTAKGAEFLVTDQEVTWGITSDTATKWFMFGSGAPANWLSPADFYNGKLVYPL
jgi:hypothetical protein